jgi:hypothetical protein
MITIAHPGNGDYLIFESSGSDWALTLPSGYDYDRARANGLALAIASLSAEKVIAPAAGANLADYGLDAPVEYRVYEPYDSAGHCNPNAKESFGFLLGGKSPGGDAYYFSVHGRIYTMSASRAEALLLDCVNILDTNVLELNRSMRPRDIAANITRVRLFENETPVFDAAPADDERAAELADALARMTAYGFARGEADAFGLLPPRYRLEFDNENGTTALYIGDAAPDGSIYAATVKSRFAFTVSPRGLWFLDRT